MIRSKDIFLEEQIVYAQMKEGIFKQIPSELRNDFKDWHNEQYPDQPYETNPYGFLVQIERIG